jgi:methylmalonyl-CoA mutase
LNIQAKKMPNLTPFQFLAITCKKLAQPLTSGLPMPAADGLYIRTGLSTGMKIDEFAPRLSFFWAIE